MAIRRSRERRPSAMAVLDGLLFGFAGVATIWLAFLVVKASIRPGWPMLLLVVFWVLLTYLLLPRLHRILTGLYVPGYFIGRARTSDGLLGDPVNLALRGHEAQIHTAMARAGWTRADDLSFRTGLRIFTSTLRRRSYHEAPVSPLHLFDRQQDFAYQQEVAGSPSKRHHVRFWRCPEDWMLPGGYSVDWLAAGTYDKSVGLSLFTLQVTHKIEEDTDIERDYIVETVKKGSAEVDVEVIDNFSTGYHSRNGGGDLIITDGDLPIINVRHIEVPEISKIEHTDSRDR
ncbi:MAG TPA: LssY C-terminal domain-containing protein, partial [Propionibacteriaceae bacterium]